MEELSLKTRDEGAYGQIVNDGPALLVLVLVRNPSLKEFVMTLLELRHLCAKKGNLLKELRSTQVFITHETPAGMSYGEQRRAAIRGA